MDLVSMDDEGMDNGCYTMMHEHIYFCAGYFRITLYLYHLALHAVHFWHS
jgi:hypothetical protein